MINARSTTKSITICYNCRINEATIPRLYKFGPVRYCSDKCKQKGLFYYRIAAIVGFLVLFSPVIFQFITAPKVVTPLKSVVFAIFLGGLFLGYQLHAFLASMKLFKDEQDLNELESELYI